MFNNNNKIHENIAIVKIKAQQLEDKAKMTKQLIKVNKGKANADLQANVSNMLIDALRAKLTILENISE